MRLVFDSNVLISSILAPNSISEKVLIWGEQNGVVLYSEDTLNELLLVLQRPKFSQYIAPEDIEGLSIRIQRSWYRILISETVKLCRDTKDDKFL